MTSPRGETPSQLMSAVEELVALMTDLCGEMHDAAFADLIDQGALETGSTGELGLRMTRLQSLANQAAAMVRAPLLGLGFVGDQTSAARGRLYWWYSPRDGAPAKQLIVDTQPVSLGYYDISHTDWWTGARDADGVYTTGPYVDVTGTNAYVVTFGKAVRTDGRFVGVVAADLAVADLQALWRRQLLAESAPVSIVDGEGAVIGTNAGRMLGGTLDLTHVEERDLESVAGTSWFIVRDAR